MCPGKKNVGLRAREREANEKGSLVTEGREGSPKRFLTSTNGGDLSSHLAWPYRGRIHPFFIYENIDTCFQSCPKSHFTMGNRKWSREMVNVSHCVAACCFLPLSLSLQPPPFHLIYTLRRRLKAGHRGGCEKKVFPLSLFKPSRKPFFVCSWERERGYRNSILCRRPL